MPFLTSGKVKIYKLYIWFLPFSSYSPWRGCCEALSGNNLVDSEPHVPDIGNITFYTSAFLGTLSHLEYGINLWQLGSLQSTATGTSPPSFEHPCHGNDSNKSNVANHLLAKPVRPNVTDVLDVAGNARAKNMFV
jgi:hypothetical protein